MNAKLLVKVKKIDELVMSLETIASDDGVDWEGYSDKKVIDEAKWVLSNFREEGHALNDALHSDDDDEKKDARKQLRQLKALVKKGCA